MSKTSYVKESHWLNSGKILQQVAKCLPVQVFNNLEGWTMDKILV